MPLAAADAIEWGSRRLDIAILGLFVAPYYVGVYYVAQQVASLPQKLKTSFDPILAPVITQKLAEGDKAAVARQVRQVGFWIIAAQAGDRAGARHSGRGGDGPGRRRAFVGGTAALAFLLAAEVVAATAAVSEAALVYVARHRNLMISLLMIAVAGGADRRRSSSRMRLAAGWRRASARPIQAAGAALGLALALGLASILKARLLAPAARRAGAGLALVADLGGGGGDRWSASASPRCRCREWLELSVGVPADPRHLRPRRLVPRLHPRGPRPVPQARHGRADPADFGPADALTALDQS